MWPFPVILLVVLLFADELVRLIVRKKVDSPILLPKGSEIRESNFLTNVLGMGAHGAAAVTVGKTILVPHFIVDPELIPEKGQLVVRPESWRQLIAHERVHIEQRRKYGRAYLLIYLFLFMWVFLLHQKYAHEHHPMEKEARKKAHLYL